MREIEYKEIVSKVQEAFIRINCEATDELLDAYSKGIEREEGNAKAIMSILKENAVLAKEIKKPICQDTGTAVIFMEMGSDIRVTGGFIGDALDEGVRLAYEEGFLRKSIVKDPFKRENTNTNLPCIVHTTLIKGDSLILEVTAKGGGSENMSRIAMLPPSAGILGVKRFVRETVKAAGPNPCPPIVVGIGIGSNFEGSAILAKKALLRPLNFYSSKEDVAELEHLLEDDLNTLGIGPQGLGGKTSVFRVNILKEPCHLASLPVAVNINCHVIRHERIVF